MDHLIIELKSVQMRRTPSQYWMMPTAVRTHDCVLCCTHTCIESHKRCPKALTNVRGRTAVLAGIMIDFFCFQSGLVA